MNILQLIGLTNNITGGSVTPPESGDTYNIVRSLGSVLRTDLSDVVIQTLSERTYYVSADGTGNGTEESPFDIAVMKLIRLNPGDTILFKRGDTFNVSNWEIKVDNITIDAYGSGDKPIFYGSKPISGFTHLGSNIWSKAVKGVKWVYIDGVSAKNAESGWIPITNAGSAQVRRVSASTINALPESIVGAQMVCKEYSFRLSETVLITAYNSSTGDITYQGPPFAGAAAGMPIKIINQDQFISSNGDWTYNSGLLKIKSSSEPTGVRISVSDTAIFVNGAANCSINNIEFRDYAKYGVLAGFADGLEIDSCVFAHMRGNATRSYGSSTGVDINNNVFTRCALRAVEISGIDGGLISHNDFSYIGEDSNLGRPWDNNKTGGTGVTIMTYDKDMPGGAVLPEDIVIEYNTMANMGYCGTLMCGHNHIVRKNVIHDYMTRWSDGGAIYYYYGKQQWNGGTTNCLTQNNIVYNGNISIEGITSGALEIAGAVYHDSGISGCKVDKNVFFNMASNGVFCNGRNTSHEFTDNLIVSDYERCGIEVSSYNSDTGGQFGHTNTSNVVLTGNTIVTLDGNKAPYSQRNNYNATTYNPFSSSGAADNNHYVNPYGTRVAARTSNDSDYTYMTLSEWQTYLGGTYEDNSTEWTDFLDTPAEDDVFVEYNATDSPVEFNVPEGYADSEGNPYTNPVEIPAWSGIVYIKLPE